MKISISKDIQSDTENVRLAKKDLLTTHLRDFDCNVLNAVEKIRELASKLEANGALSSSRVDDLISILRDKICCEDFHLHFFLKWMNLNTIDIELMLTELESKFTNLVKQNEWLSSNPSSSMDCKFMAIAYVWKQPTNSKALVRALESSL